MRAATLFSGIGAPECAMPGWRWLWHAEIEKFPTAVMKVRHPESVNIGDVDAQDFVERAENVGRPDVLVFGSPCQSFSVAGKRLGMDDARGNLALVGLGIAQRLRPRWVVFENVPGLLSSYSGGEQAQRALDDRIAADGWLDAGGFTECEEDSDFAALLSAFRECGYLGGYRVFDAQHSGVPQRRRRVFFVGHLGDWRPAFAVLFEPESLRGDPAPDRPARQNVAGTITSGLGRRGGADEGDRGTLVPAVANSITSRANKGVDSSLASQTLIAFEPRERGDDGRGHARAPNFMRDCSPTLNGTKTPAIAFDCKAGGKTSFSIGDVAGALRGDGHGGGHAAVFVPEVAGPLTAGTNASGGHRFPGVTADEAADKLMVFKPSHFTRGKDGAPSDLAPPLSPDADKGDQEAVLLQGATVRRLTPRECERLQGLEDDYTLIPWRGAMSPDGPRYRALGNSMNVKDVRAILRRIELFEKIVGGRA